MEKKKRQHRTFDNFVEMLKFVRNQFQLSSQHNTNSIKRLGQIKMTME